MTAWAQIQQDWANKTKSKQVTGIYTCRVKILLILIYNPSLVWIKSREKQ